MNSYELKDFITVHELKEPKTGVIRFYADLMIKTQFRSNTFRDALIGVEYSAYNNAGKITVLEGCDDENYPLDYNLDFVERMNHVDGKFLEINDVHGNKKIGKFNVKIYPNRRM